MQKENESRKNKSYFVIVTMMLQCVTVRSWFVFCEGGDERKENRGDRGGGDGVTKRSGCVAVRMVFRIVFCSCSSVRRGY